MKMNKETDEEEEQKRDEAGEQEGDGKNQKVLESW